MINLSDFLKTQKVRCVKAYGDCLTVGKEYSVLDIRMEVKVKDDEGDNCYWESDSFEPVIDDMPKSAENPLQGVELTPEFEAVEPVLADNSVNLQDIGTDILDTNTDIKDTPKFEVGDKVYYSTDKEIYTISEIDSENSGLAYLSQNDDDWDTNAILKFCCHATQENYEMLCKLYPHIEFEPPPKPLTGSDLARALIKKGWVGFNCLCGHSGDENAITDTIVTGINNGGQFTTIDGRLFNNAIPMKGWRQLQAQEVGL